MDGLTIFFTVIGYIGAVGIAIYNIPVLIDLFKNKRTSHLNKHTLLLFIILTTGAVCLAASGLYTLGVDPNPDWAGSASFSLSVAIANIFSFSTSFAVLGYKWYRVKQAKKLGITEKELEERDAAKKTSGPTA